MPNPSLALTLKAQLTQAADNLPVPLLSAALMTLETLHQQLAPELTDSDNQHAHTANTALRLALDELALACSSFAAARQATTAYAAVL